MIGDDELSKMTSRRSVFTPAKNGLQVSPFSNLFSKSNLVESLSRDEFKDS